MTMTRALQLCALLLFLCSTVSGFLYTISIHRVYLPFVPRPLTYLSYSAMAPYQGMGRGNRALAAQGRTVGGRWEEIDLRRYYPASRGRQDIRMLEVGWVRIAKDKLDDALYRRKMQALAVVLRDRERSRGVHYEAVRLFWDDWPYSRLGHDALHDTPERTRTFLVETP